MLVGLSEKSRKSKVANTGNRTTDLLFQEGNPLIHFRWHITYIYLKHNKYIKAMHNRKLMFLNIYMTIDNF